MARRLLKSPWSSVFKKSMTAMTRSVVRASGKAINKAVNKAVKDAIQSALPKPTRPKASAKRVEGIKALRAPAGRAVVGKKARPAARKTPASRSALAPAGGTWTRGVAIGPGGARAYHLYRPAGLSAAAPVPLMVMLHGCGQTAEAFAASTRMNRIAARAGFCVLYPEQDRHAHSQGCWNWYAIRSRVAYAEAATLIAAIDQVALSSPVDRSRVAVVGLSAGAGMAALLASRYPERFRAVVMHSGVPPGAAHSSASALGAMLGNRRPPAQVFDAAATPWPPLLVIHGNADSVVAAANGRSAALLWAQAAGALPSTPRVVRRGMRHPVTVTDYKRRGRLVASLCEVDGLSHAWSGGAASQAFGDARGPDASGMVWAFVARELKRSATRSVAA